MAMTYEQAKAYIDSAIAKQISSLKPEFWVRIDESGVICDLTECKYTFKTKHDAIHELALDRCDARKTPKVFKMNAGYYLYQIKDMDTGLLGVPISIMKVTKSNFDNFINRRFKPQLEAIRDMILNQYKCYGDPSLFEGYVRSTCDELVCERKTLDVSYV